MEPNGDGSSGSGRPRAGTMSSASGSSRYRSISSGLGSSELYRDTPDTPQTSVMSHDAPSGYFGTVTSSSQLHTLVETISRGEQPDDTQANGHNEQVHPHRSRELHPGPSDSNVNESARPRFLARIGRRSTTDLLQTPSEESVGMASSSSPRTRRKFLRTLSDLGRSRNGSTNRLGMSVNDSTSSLQQPSTPGSPYISLDHAASTASSVNNVNGGLRPQRVSKLRRVSNLALRGRSRASTVSAGSSQQDSSRSPSPLPPLPIRAGTPPIKRQSNRLRSASEPLRGLVQNLPQSMPGIDYFDLLLPRELRLVVFDTLLRVCESDLESLILRDVYVGDLARDKRWVGRAAGVREIIKCSRVSRTWHALALDLQLWRDFDMTLMGNDVISTPSLLRILGSAYALKKLDLTGMANFTPAAVIALADSISCFTSNGTAQNGLVELTLTGCRSLTANSLHYLVSRSPHLRALHLPGLRSVTNSIFDLLSVCVHDLRLLNINRCANTEGRAVLALGPRHARLVDLRIAGLRNVTDDVLANLALAFPDLQRLDLCDAFELTNEGIRRFVAWPDDPPDGVKMILAPPHDKPRRLTRLRHLILSGCVTLSDMACDALQGTCPDLVALELAGVGPHFQVAGLVALLKTTPELRKLDLDGAFNLQDRALPALNAHATKLNHLVLSGCSGFSERAIQQFLRHFGEAHSQKAAFELDSTAVTESMLRDLVLKRKMAHEVVAIDCRSVGRSVSNDLAAASRPRHGVRGWKQRAMNYHDDERFGPREMDPSRTVLKTFGTLSLLDAADQARDARRRRLEGLDDLEDQDERRPRWTRSRSEGGCIIS